MIQSKTSDVAYMINNKVFVVGNGPSLRHFDLSTIDMYDWVGMNAAYRHWDRIGIYPKYYSCLDLNVGVSHIQEIIRLVKDSKTNKIKLFLLRDNIISSSKLLKESSIVINYDEKFSSFPDRITKQVTTGSHTLLWMHLLGFKQIILLGIDINYKEFVDGSTFMGKKKNNILKITKKLVLTIILISLLSSLNGNCFLLPKSKIRLPTSAFILSPSSAVIIPLVSSLSILTS